MVLKAMPTGRANARPMTGCSASSGDARSRASHHEGLADLILRSGHAGKFT